MERERPIISVDDTALLQNDYDERRAFGASLYKLNSAHDIRANLDVTPDVIYKCPSFPRIDKSDRERDNHYGRTSLFPESFQNYNLISPGVSIETIDCGGHCDRFSTGGQVGLLRSISANTVDSLPPVDCFFSPGGSPGGSGSAIGHASSQRFLSPHPMDVESGTNITTRSTSCPGLSEILGHESHRQSRSPTGSERHKGRRLPCQPPSTHHYGQYRDDPNMDINLEGEVITDLPIEPVGNFPDLFTADQGCSNNSSNHDTQHNYRGYHERSENKQTPSKNRSRSREPSKYDSVHHSKTFYPKHSHSRNVGPSVMNIGDIPSEIACQIMAGPEDFSEDVNDDDHIRERCQKWLDGLST